MNLQIRDPRARELAQKLAEQRQVSMTEAVIEALEAELRRGQEAKPLKDRVAKIVQRLNEKARPGGRDLTRDEIDEMWGH